MLVVTPISPPGMRKILNWSLDVFAADMTRRVFMFILRASFWHLAGDGNNRNLDLKVLLALTFPNYALIQFSHPSQTITFTSKAHWTVSGMFEFSELSDLFYYVDKWGKHDVHIIVFHYYILLQNAICQNNLNVED